MSGMCCFRVRWDSEEIISYQRNISVNLTEEISASPSLNTNAVVFSTLISVILVLGISCNVTSFIVLSRLTIKSPFSCCLLFLAGFDAVFLSSLLAKELLRGTAKSLAFFTVLQRCAWTGSAWTTVSISVERFIAIFFTLRAKSLCTYKRTVFFNLFILFFVICINIPLFVVLHEISWEGDLMKTYMYLYDVRGLQAASLAPLWFLRNKEFFEVCYLYLSITVIYCLPLLLVAVLRTSICVALRKAERIRREMTQNQGIKKLGRFKVYNWIISIFSVTYFLALILAIPSYNGVAICSYVHAYETLSYVLICANSSVRYVVYCSVWEDFRDAQSTTFSSRRTQNVAAGDNLMRTCAL